MRRLHLQIADGERGGKSHDLRIIAQTLEYQRFIIRPVGIVLGNFADRFEAMGAGQFVGIAQPRYDAIVRDWRRAGSSAIGFSYGGSGGSAGGFIFPMPPPAPHPPAMAATAKIQTAGKTHRAKR